MKLTNFQAIIVDLDGTLYFQRPVRLAMLKEMVFHFWRVRDFVIIKRYRELFELGYNEKERLLSLPSDAESVFREWMIIRPLQYIKRFRDKELIRILRTAEEKGIMVIVYSDYPVHEKLEALQFRPDLAVSASDIGSMKPDPAGMLLLLKRIGVNPASCLVIGDREAKDGYLADNLCSCKLILPREKRQRQELYESENIGFA